MSRTTLTELSNRVSTKLFWTIFIIVFVGFTIISFANQSALSDETRSKRISQQLRCIECEGLSVAESNTPNSKTITRDVQRRVDDGQTDAEIFAYYQGIYGEYIRLAPTASSGNWIVYAVPAFGALVFIAALILSIRKNTSKRLLYGFWISTAVITMVGIGLFVNDARNSNETIEITAQDTRQQLEREAQQNPTATNIRNLAIYQFAREEYIEALKNFDRAVELDKNDALSRAYSSYIVLQAGEYELALQRAESAVAIAPNDPTAIFFRSVILYQTPSEDEAVKADLRARAEADFDRVIELAPNSTFAQQIRDLRKP